MNSILEFLKGKKTYITAIVMFLAGGANAAGLIDNETYQKIVTVLLPLAIGFLRAGVNKR